MRPPPLQSIITLLWPFIMWLNCDTQCYASKFNMEYLSSLTSSFHTIHCNVCILIWIIWLSMKRKSNENKEFNLSIKLMLVFKFIIFFCFFFLFDLFDYEFIWNFNEISGKIAQFILNRFNCHDYDDHHLYYYDILIFHLVKST